VHNGVLGVWSLKVPVGWEQTVCKEPHGSLCSYNDNTTSTDVWFDPADNGARITVSTCFFKGCGSLVSGNRPIVEVPFQVTSSVRINSWEIAFHIDENVAFGNYPIDGIVEAAHMGLEPAFPMVTVTVSLPASQHSLATGILDSLYIFPAAACGG
jgi:hypothetical protein